MSEIPQELINYMATRDRQRDEQVTTALGWRTPAELAVMKDAAVMGYVLGTRAVGDTEIPPDTAILRNVVAACLELPDLYPAIGAPESDGAGR